MKFGDSRGASMIHSLQDPLTDAAGANVLSSFTFDGNVKAGAGAQGEMGPFEKMLTQSLSSLVKKL